MEIASTKFSVSYFLLEPLATKSLVLVERSLNSMIRISNLRVFEIM